MHSSRIRPESRVAQQPGLGPDSFSGSKRAPASGPSHCGSGIADAIYFWRRNHSFYPAGEIMSPRQTQDVPGHQVRGGSVIRNENSTCNRPVLAAALGCRPKMKMSAFTKIEMSSFLEARNLKSCSNPVSRSPSSSEQHALRCGRVKLSTKRSSFDSLKA